MGVFVNIRIQPQSLIVAIELPVDSTLIVVGQLSLLVYPMCIHVYMFTEFYPLILLGIPKDKWGYQRNAAYPVRLVYSPAIQLGLHMILVGWNQNPMGTLWSLVMIPYNFINHRSNHSDR